MCNAGPNCAADWLFSRRRGQRTVTASTGATARQAWALCRIASKLANDTSATMPRRNPSHFAPSMAGNSASQGGGGRQRPEPDTENRGTGLGVGSAGL